ncbi:TonB-dependent receptor [Mucilaginibacter arboris]|uniref:TonB-dependent receptor plug domain-containing protein n=1 Tax=Mucilaginibacter arboris TaxID=2682090 RepID=A0A7K1T022_9SPHI|nr:carboxypeptidase regulatory-like domain-containing protein [Mucilaginibacter arboris]MVN22903.1 TonB-dependent receptor plug domain-containing protein [Mucilaginibacter arboris]
MKKYLLLISFLFILKFANAQLTTGSVTGTIRDSKGESLIGASVRATHVPSGSVYGASTNANGQFTIPNMRVGSPYTIVVSYIGYNSRTFNDIVISLGNPLKLDVALQSQTGTLAEVSVTATKNTVISSERNGTSTRVGITELQQLPTITRNIQDFARLTPQATVTSSNTNGAPLGISFGGMNSKYNRFTIDGATASDVFGLSSTGTNGGQASANPIPLDAIQEMQIVVAPYDVTYVGFAGGGINAVTKSGTNSFHGSAYTYLQNQNGIGKSVTTDLKYADFTKTIYGASLGGPIVKDKLFFFADFERSKNSTPLAYDPTQSGSGSKFNPSVLEDLRNYVIKTYSFDPGSYSAINKVTPSTTVFGRLDWNINEKNKLTIRHSYVDASDLVISRSVGTITFANSAYTFASKTNSSVLELNSSFSNNASNVFRLTYNRVRDARVTADFPSIFIQDKTNSLNYNIGSDYSSPRNSLNQDNFSVTDNFNLYKGIHTITLGTNNDFYNTNNVFLQYYYGYYTYASIDAFKNNATVAPISYQVGYSTAGGADNAASIIHAAQFRVYAQDAMQVNEKFKFTYGIGLELPVFFNKPLANTAFNNSALAQRYNVATDRTVTPAVYVTPRMAFNWDINGDGTSQLRGGGGVFTGPAPFVWLSNQYGGTGVNSIRYSPTGTALNAIRFNYNPNDTHLGAPLPTTTVATTATEIDVTDHNFKFPTIFRTNLALDQKLPFWGLIGTVEGLYSKTFNNILYQNLNVGPQSGVTTIGNTTRPYYNFTRADANYTDVIYLTNTNQGYTYNVTAQIQKPLTRGWTGSIAYTYGDAFSVSDGTSSTALSNWRFVYNVNGLNSPDLSRANFSPGSRIVGYISKSFKYASNKLATNVGVVYIGQSGQTFSYLYGSGNINGDDITSKTQSQDLAYIPANIQQAQFVDFVRTNADNSKTTVTAAQQWTDFQNFIKDNSYLRDHQGQNTTRNGDRMPWENHIDLKLSQDFYFVKQHKLEISVDIQNIGNLLNSKWGRGYYLGNQSYNLFTPISQTRTPTFTFDATKLTNVDGTLRPYTINDFSSRWRGQISARYSF